jgi:hypothetical protein
VYDILIGITQYLLYMKLSQLIEGYHKVKREPYDIDLHVTVDRGDVTTFTAYIDVFVKEYDNVISDIPSTIGNVLNDVYSMITTEYPDDTIGHIGIRELNMKDLLNGGGSTIVIGNLNRLSNISRVILINIEEPEEDIELIKNSIYNIKFPTLDECMTQLKKSNMIVKAATRRLDVRDINIELSLTPKINVITNIVLSSTPEDEDEESIGFKIARSLKPYNIRPQINGGVIIGTK